MPPDTQAAPADPSRSGQKRRRASPANPSLSMRMAAAAGLTGGLKTKHVNAKVQPALFDAAARRLGSESPAAVIEAALAALATQDDLGPWLAGQWGALANVDPYILAAIDL